jgi:glycosyltransferase involved in cell wall biosynthesis
MNMASALHPVTRRERPAAARLRILLVVDSYYPGTGGAERQARLLSSAFARVGHKVRVVAPRIDPADPVRETLDGVPVERIVYPRIAMLGALILCARFAWKLLRERRQYDAIHVHMAENLAAVAGLLRPLLCASLTVKISGASEFEGGILDPARRRRPLNALLNRWIRRSDNIQCISCFTYQRLLEAGYPQERLRMIPNGVDLPRYTPKTPGEHAVRSAARVVYAGRLQPVKGVRVLIEAWSVLAAAHSARLAIAGDGDLREELEARSAQLGLGKRIEFRGDIDDVPALLRDADIYVQPSFQEGMPNSVLEAMAAGLPIVATQVSGNVDLVTDGDNGLLVPPGDAAALAAAIGRLLEDPALARRMGERSRMRVEREFGLPSVMARLEMAYRREV